MTTLCGVGATPSSRRFVRCEGRFGASPLRRAERLKAGTRSSFAFDLCVENAGPGRSCGVGDDAFTKTAEKRRPFGTGIGRLALYGGALFRVAMPPPPRGGRGHSLACATASTTH